MSTGVRGQVVTGTMVSILREDRQRPCSHSNATRSLLKQALLARAAEARDKACTNSEGSICKKITKGYTDEGKSSKDRDQGKGIDRYHFAATIISERDAIRRLLAS